MKRLNMKGELFLSITEEMEASIYAWNGTYRGSLAASFEIKYPEGSQ